MTDGMAAVAALEAGDIALIHGSLPAPVLAELRSRGPVVGIAHQAIYDSSRPAYYGAADVMFGVSRHVVATLRANGVASALSAYSADVGRPPLPPAWAFGPWLSSDHWRDGGEVRYVV